MLVKEFDDHMMEARAKALAPLRRKRLLAFLDMVVGACGFALIIVGICGHLWSGIIPILGGGMVWVVFGNGLWGMWTYNRKIIIEKQLWEIKHAWS